MAVGVSSGSHPSYVLTGPFPFVAARVAPVVLCIQFAQITNPQALWCYKIPWHSFPGFCLLVNI